MKTKVFGYLHTHWDREWYRNKEDFNIRLLEVLNVVLDELKHNRAPFFYLDGQVLALLDYLKYRQEKKEQIIQFIKEKKLAIGPYFVSADSFLLSFASMIKNLEIGLKYSNEFSQKEFIGYMSDIFGISKSAFAALKLKNIDKAAIWRGVNPKSINNCSNFKINSINTVWLAQGYFNDFCHTGNVEGLKNYLDKIKKYSPNSILLPIGADHLGMLENANKKIELINSKLEDYEIILTSPFEYFKREKFEIKPSCEEFLDNSDTYILNGVYSSRIYQKIKNVELENLISRIVEPLNSFLKLKYDKNLEIIWQTLIKNHAHDGIYGCSLDSVAHAVDYRFEKCENALLAILDNIKGKFIKKHNLKGKSSNKIGVFNLSNCPIGLVKIELPYVLDNSQIISVREGFDENLLFDIQKIPVTEDICPIYTQIVEISPQKPFSFGISKIKKPAKKVKINDKKIKNGFISFEIKDCKMTVLNKKTNKKYGFRLCDIKDLGDTYNHAPKGKAETFEIIKSYVLYNGPIQSCLRVEFKNILLDIILENNSKMLKFSALIDNKTKNHKLQAVFELEEEIKTTIAQDAVGFIKRSHEPNYNIQDYMPAKRPKELKTNIYPAHNLVSAQNVSILSKGLFEYEIYNKELKLCLLRCSGTISNPKNPVRAIPAGPDLKTPEAQCIRQIHSQFAIVFENEKKALYTLDEFFENYVTIGGAIKEDLGLKFEDVEENSFIYGFVEGKKIVYNTKTKAITYEKLKGAKS